VSCCGSSPTPSCTLRRSSGPTSRGVTYSRPSSTTKDGTGGSAGSLPDMSRNLLVRIAVAVPAIAGAVAALWLGGWVLAAAIALLGVLGTNEVYAFAKKQGLEPLEWVGFVAAAAFPFATYWAKDYADWEPVVYGGAAWLLVALVVAAARGPERHPLTALAADMTSAPEDRNTMRMSSRASASSSTTRTRRPLRTAGLTISRSSGRRAGSGSRPPTRVAVNGRSTVKVAPRFSPGLSARATPPWSSTMCRTMASPSPRPPCRRPIDMAALDSGSPSC